MAHAAADHGHGHGHGHGHFIVPQALLMKVFGGLVFLTIFTVLTAKFVDLGPFNIVLALLIAGGKAMLVVTYFMALKYDAPVNRLVFGLGVFFVIVFLTFTLFDTAFRGDDASETVVYPNEQVEGMLEQEAGGDDHGTENVAPATGDPDNTVGDGDTETHREQATSAATAEADSLQRH